MKILNWMKSKITQLARWWIKDELQMCYQTATIQNEKLKFIVERNHELGAYANSLFTQLHGRIH